MVQEPKEKEERKRVPLVMEQEVSPAPNKAFWNGAITKRMSTM